MLYSTFFKYAAPIYVLFWSTQSLALDIREDQLCGTFSYAIQKSDSLYLLCQIINRLNDISEEIEDIKTEAKYTETRLSEKIEQIESTVDDIQSTIARRR